MLDSWIFVALRWFVGDFKGFFLFMNLLMEMYVVDVMDLLVYIVLSLCEEDMVLNVKILLWCLLVMLLYLLEAFGMFLVVFERL